MGTDAAPRFDYDVSDIFGTFFEPDVILPGQFSALEPGLEGGERSLMAAVLSDGVQSYILHRLSHRGEDADHANWVERRDRSYVFSFDVVCESLGIDPEYLRRGIEAHIFRMLADERSARWRKIRRPRQS